MAERKLFVRKATGLVREIGPLTAVIIIMANTIGLGWQKRAFQYTGPAIVPENTYVLGLPPIAMAFILVGIVVLFTVWVFAILGAAMPRSGGGYVYISRILSPPIGFIASWMEFFSIAVSWGLIGTAVLEAILIYAKIAQLPGGFTGTLATPEVLFVGGVLIVAAFGAISALGARMAGRLLQAIFWIPAILTLMIYGVMLSATPAAINAGLLTVGNISADAVTKKALDLGMATAFPGGYWGAVGVASLGAYWAYIGFAASTFVAGEIKEASRTIPRTLFYANGLIILIYITFSIVAYRAASLAGHVSTPQGDFSFFSAYAYLSHSGCDGCKAALGNLPSAWTPNIAGFAALGSGLGIVTLLIPLFAALWVANDIPPFVLTSSRIMFAMAFDRVLPEKLAEVNERWHSPVNAVMATMFVAFLGNFAESDILVKYNVPVLKDYLNSFSGVQATDIWDTIFFLFASIAGLLFVWRKRDIYESSAYKPSIGGFPAITVIGLLATVANLMFLYYGEILGWYIPEPWILTLVLIIVGGLIYYYYRSKGSRVGVDYSTIYAQIPPE